MTSILDYYHGLPNTFHPSWSFPSQPKLPAKSRLIVCKENISSYNLSMQLQKTAYSPVAVIHGSWQSVLSPLFQPNLPHRQILYSSHAQSSAIYSLYMFICHCDVIKNPTAVAHTLACLIFQADSSVTLLLRLFLMNALEMMSPTLC